MNVLQDSKSASGKKLRFTTKSYLDPASDSDSDSLDLPESSSSSKAKQEEPDYYDPVYFDSDDYEDEDDEEQELSGQGKISKENQAQEQDDDEKAYDARAGISKDGSLDEESLADVSMKDITTGLEKSSLASSSTPQLSTSSSLRSKKSSKGKKPKQQQRTISDADLLYDPDEDDRDQDWLLKKIAANRPPGCKPEDIWTDAILSCPMCLTQLCFDCQQHEFYPHQFRAMFIEHCRVVETEVLRFPAEAKKANKTSLKPSSASRVSSKSTSAAASTTGVMDAAQGFKPSVDDDEDMAYHPVLCEICNTKVALMDQDEVFHFFNVIPAEV